MRRLLNCVDDVADDQMHELLVVAFRHDADDGLGARRANNDAAVLTKLFLGTFNGSAHATVFKRTFCSTWGSGVKRAQTSETGLPVATTQARTCSAETRPSPVVVKSDSTMCPDCSPPTL